MVANRENHCKPQEIIVTAGSENPSTTKHSSMHAAYASQLAPDAARPQHHSS